MENNDNLQDELSSFRQQWHSELQEQQRSRSNSPQLQLETPSDNAAPQKGLRSADEESVESRAKVLFLTGVSLEQKKRMPEAIRYYRQAIQLLPDIESRISDFNELLPKPDSSQEIFTEDLNDDEDEGIASNCNNASVYTSKDLENVINEFDKMSVKGICEAAFPSSKTHISVLPAELLMYIFKWAVSSSLDLRSLEKLSQVCKGFYALARDPEIWRLACVRIWGVNLGSAVSWNGSWREMYLKRAHLQYNGVYISKVSYTRPSEPTFEQQYTPYQLIIYYRYLRFFTDGSVLFLTSPDEPQVSISRLSTKIETPGNVWSGNYRLVGNKVLLVIQRVENFGYSSRRRGRRLVPQNNERVFHMELQLQNAKKKRNNKLTWVQYTCQTFCRYSGQTTVSHFDLNNEQFRAFHFSRVKSYESALSAPLVLGRASSGHVGCE